MTDGNRQAHFTAQYLPSQGQQGMALVIVLFMLLLLAAASVIALTDSQTSLQLTTAAQVKQLLFQASDVPLAHIDKVLQDPVLLAQWSRKDGPIGYLVRPGEQFATAEYVICYQPTERATLYAGSHQHKVIHQTGRVKNRDGYCQIGAASKGNYFTSERQVVATQISFVRLDRPTIEDGGAEKVADSQPIRIRAYVVSVIPLLSQASLIEVDTCLALPMAVSKERDRTSLIACLQRTHTPYNLQAQDYLYGSQRELTAGMNTERVKLTPLQWLEYGNHLPVIDSH
ncbi:hypothetical protein [Psychrobacter lutiphocae]|uniref:hypothetical protein n=1 Tax=Psychrobacter lutiphocae TaxID=540500 RepID=UPI00037BA3C1|nr:hypothetical protein [Psychrobacter lutiphocae]